MQKHIQPPEQFLRKKDNPSESFVTIELDSSGKRIVQAKGFANNDFLNNNNPDKETLGFISRWTNSKSIAI